MNSEGDVDMFSIGCGLVPVCCMWKRKWLCITVIKHVELIRDLGAMAQVWYL